MEYLENHILKKENKFINIYTIVSFIGGFLLFLLFYSLIKLFEDFSATNTIEVISILVNLGFGVIIFFLVEKKIGDDRAVKDLFIQDVKDIKSNYKAFLIKLNHGSCNSKEINKWFKLMSINIQQFEYFVSKEFGIEKDKLKLQEFNRKMQKSITGSPEFNENFNNPVIEFEIVTTLQIIELNKEFKHALTDVTVKITRA
jgi:hypothetical protein